MASTRRRIGLAVILAVSLALSPLSAEAQSAGKAWRIGFLGDSPGGPFRQAFEQGLRELGYVDGQNIVIDYRPAELTGERLPLLAAELVRLPDDAIDGACKAGKGTRRAKRGS